ncbi:MAG: hypothetical protein ABIK62_07785 [candidate division WOR-3 bacterium]
MTYLSESNRPAGNRPRPAFRYCALVAALILAGVNQVKAQPLSFWRLKTIELGLGYPGTLNTGSFLEYDVAPIKGRPHPLLTLGVGLYERNLRTLAADSIRNHATLFPVSIHFLPIVKVPRVDDDAIAHATDPDDIWGRPRRGPAVAVDRVPDYYVDLYATGSAWADPDVLPLASSGFLSLLGQRAYLRTGLQICYVFSLGKQWFGAFEEPIRSPFLQYPVGIDVGLTMSYEHLGGRNFENSFYAGLSVGGVQAIRLR